MRKSFPSVLVGSACVAAALCGMVGAARAQQCQTTACNPDDIFVGNFLNGDLVRFSKADIAANGNAATGVIIAAGFGNPEGLANDFDGTIIVTTRFTGNVERVCRDGSQRAIEANVNLSEGPSFAPNGDLFLNDTGPTCITYKAPAAVPFGGLAFVPWITTHPAGTFCEDTRVAPALSPLFPGELFVERSAVGGNPTAIDAFSASVADTPLGAVIPDFGTVAGLGAGAFQSLGFAFDSQGDIWVTRFGGPAGVELIEYSAASNYGFSRSVSLTRPGGGAIPDGNLGKLCITPPDPSDPLNPGRDTILVADFAGFLHVVDEVSGTQLFSVSSNLVDPVGVACCDVIVGIPTGACCNAANPSGSPLCTDDVLPDDCVAAGLQHFPGKTCAEVESQGLCVAVPAVSEWGLVVLTLIGLVSGSIVFGRWRPAKA